MRRNTGLALNVSGGTTNTDISGTSGSWSVTSAGAGTFTGVTTPLTHAADGTSGTAATFRGGNGSAGAGGSATLQGGAAGAGTGPLNSGGATIDAGNSIGAGTSTITFKAAAPSSGNTVNTSSTVATLSSSGLTLYSPLAVGSGGTGQSVYTNGQLLIGNSTGNTLTAATLSAGSGIQITNGTGSITIATTGAAPTGPASGDLANNYPNPTIATTAGSDITAALNSATPTNPIDVAAGGTGAASLTANDLLVGNGTSAIKQLTTPNNEVLTSNGSGVPTWSTTLGGVTINGASSIGGSTSISTSGAISTTNTLGAGATTVTTLTASGNTSLNASPSSGGTVTIGNTGPSTTSILGNVSFPGTVTFTTAPTIPLTTNDLFVGVSGDAAPLATGNGGVLNTSSTGVPSITATPTLGVTSAGGSPATGTLSFANSSSASLTTIEAGNATAAVTYELPTAAPGAANDVLQANTTTSPVQLSWVAPATSTSGDVNYNVASANQQASAVAPNYLFDIAYTSTTGNNAAVGALITSNTTTGNGTATGLTIDAASHNGASTGLVFDVAGGGANIDITGTSGWSITSAGQINGTVHNATTGFELNGGATTGTILIGNGVNYVASTATYPATLATANELLYTSAANTVSALATGDNGVLVTGATGIPSISTTLPTGLTLGGETINGATTISISGAISTTSTLGVTGLTTATGGISVPSTAGINNSSTANTVVASTTNIDATTGAEGVINIGNAGGTTPLDSSTTNIYGAVNMSGNVNFTGTVTLPSGSVTSSSIALAHDDIFIGDHTAGTADTAYMTQDVTLSNTSTHVAQATVNGSHATTFAVSNAMTVGGDATFNGAGTGLTVTNASTLTGAVTATNAGNNIAGAFNGTVGGTTPSTGAFTTLTSNTSFNNTGTLRTTGGTTDIDVTGTNPINIGDTSGAMNINIGNNSGPSVTTLAGTVDFTGTVSLPAGSVSASSIGLTQNYIFVGNSSNDAGAVAPTANEVLITGGGGSNLQPLWSNTLPSGLTYPAAQITGAGTIGGSTVINTTGSIQTTGTLRTTGTTDISTTGTNPINIGDTSGAMNINIGNNSGPSVTTIAGTVSFTGSVTLPSGTTVSDVGVTAQTTGTFYPTFVNTSSTNATVALGVSGGMSFNAATDALTLGKPGASGITGSIVLDNSANAFTTTIEASTSSTASAVYELPVAGGSANQVLETTGASSPYQLQWVTPNAGTITGTLTTNGAVYATGASAIASTAQMTAGQLLIGSGASSAPLIGAITTTGSGISATYTSPNIVLANTGVVSVGNAASDNTLTLAGTGSGRYTGAVTAKLNLANANTWTGTQTFGGAALTSSTTTAATPSQSDWGLSTSNSYFKVSSTAATTVYGITGGADGRVIVLVNEGSYNITFSSDNTTETTAANRIHLAGNSGSGTYSLILAPDGILTLIYDSSYTGNSDSGAWRVLSSK